MPGAGNGDSTSARGIAGQESTGPTAGERGARGRLLMGILGNRGDAICAADNPSSQSIRTLRSIDGEHTEVSWTRFA